MRVLALSQWYEPEPDIKIHLLCKELVARGHSVTAITGFPNYPMGRFYPGYRIRWRQWEERDGVRVLRVPLYPDHSRSGIKRALNYMSFAASASLLGPVLAGGADVMWVYHPPLTVGIPAWWIGLLRRIPFVYEIQDMWPETAAATGMLTNSFALGCLGKLAAFIYKQAAAITVISPGFKRNLIAKGVDAEKIQVIPNWADEDVYRPVVRDERLAQTYGLIGKFNIIYAGNLGAAQALRNVINVAEMLQDLAEVQFVFIGDGVDEVSLKEDVARAGLTNVRFIGRQPREQMPHFFSLADALLIHLRKDPLFEITIPGKTIAYLACGKPILCVAGGDAADVVREAGAGVSCEPENPVALAAATRELYAMTMDRRDAMGRAGRRAFLAQYTRTILVERYEKLLTMVARAGGDYRPAGAPRGLV